MLRKTKSPRPQEKIPAICHRNFLPTCLGEAAMVVGAPTVRKWRRSYILSERMSNRGHFSLNLRGEGKNHFQDGAPRGSSSPCPVLFEDTLSVHEKCVKALFWGRLVVHEIARSAKKNRQKNRFSGGLISLHPVVPFGFRRYESDVMNTSSDLKNFLRLGRLPTGTFRWHREG